MEMEMEKIVLKEIIPSNEPKKGSSFFFLLSINYHLCHRRGGGLYDTYGTASYASSVLTIDSKFMGVLKAFPVRF